MNNTENSLEKCPVCKRKDNRLLYTVDGETLAKYILPDFRNKDKIVKLKLVIEDIWGQNTCSFHKCNYCGFCFSIPFIAANNEYYSIIYDNNHNYPVWKWEFEITIQAIHELVENNSINENFNFLEIGAGNGSFVKKIISDFSKEIQITCTEFSESAKNSISADLNVECFSKDVREMDEMNYNNYFDVICMFQVLEHLDELDELFEHLYKISSEKCNLFIGVPNFEHRAFFDKYGFIEDIPPHHISRWNEINLKLMGQRFGWKLINYQKEPFDFNKFIYKYRNVILRNNEFINKVNNKLIRKIIRKFDGMLSHIRLMFHMRKLKNEITNDLGLIQLANFIKQ